MNINGENIESGRVQVFSPNYRMHLMFDSWETIWIVHCEILPLFTVSLRCFHSALPQSLLFDCRVIRRRGGFYRRAESRTTLTF